MDEIRGETTEKVTSEPKAAEERALTALQDLAVSMLQGGDRQRFATCKRVCDMAHALMRTLAPSVDDFDDDDDDGYNDDGGYNMAMPRRRRIRAQGGGARVADNANILRELSTAAMAVMNKDKPGEDIASRRSLLVARIVSLEGQMNAIEDGEAKELAIRAFEQAKAELRVVCEPEVIGVLEASVEDAKRPLSLPVAVQKVP